ncbi:MAG TPA: glycoside hydrolase family 15 protein [Thermomicrobiales bacterium]|nr:glycoside hydrolase family 15 protein [Thermomicrobiales bacterium]
MTRIEDYGMLADLQTAALVRRDGSLDWCCFPRFDSPAAFAAIVGDAGNGRWLIAPAHDVLSTSRRYRDDTFILETTHVTASGTVRITDFMPIRDEHADIVRIVEGVAGTVAMTFDLAIRFDYGDVVPWVRRVDGARVATAGPDAIALRTPVELHGKDLTTVAEFLVREGERLEFMLTWYPSHMSPPPAIDVPAALARTEAFWQDWSARSGIDGRYPVAVDRSLLVLKALTYGPTGGLVAAPTTSLPEWIGSVRNWDYRYCWLRDASLTLVAMMRAGHSDEAEAWRDWLLRAIAGDPERLQIMYGIAGERHLAERELEHLRGFADSRPVRIGNAASEQLQLDVYGEVVDALYLALVHGAPPSHFASALIRHMLDWLGSNWRRKDAGIWEVRGPIRHFTHSKVMAWVAFDRAVKLHEEFGMDGPVANWRAIRDEIHADVLAHAWSEKRQAFAQAYGTDELDASVLMMSVMGFLSADDPRMVATVAAVEQGLMEDGLLLRYRSTGKDGDGLPPGEGTFLACSFWFVETLVLQGETARAQDLFDRLLTLQNDLGLLAEEYDPVAGQQLGNFPQAFSHLALVNAALTLETHATR